MVVFPEPVPPQIPMTSRLGTIIPQAFLESSDRRKILVGEPTMATDQSPEPLYRRWRFCRRHPHSLVPFLRYYLRFPFSRVFFAARSSMTAWAAARRAIGTRKGDALT